MISSSYDDVQLVQDGVEREHRTVEHVRRAGAAQPKVRLQQRPMDALLGGERRLQRIGRPVGAHALLADDHFLRFAQHEDGIVLRHVLVDYLRSCRVEEIYKLFLNKTQWIAYNFI